MVVLLIMMYNKRIISMKEIIIFGSYSIVTSNFIKWISILFKVMSGQVQQGGGSAGANKSKGEISEQKHFEGEVNRNKSENIPGVEKQGKKPEKNGAGNGNQEISIISILKVISTYLSIAGVFAV